MQSKIIVRGKEKEKEIKIKQTTAYKIIASCKILSVNCGSCEMGTLYSYNLTFKIYIC